MVKTPRFQCRGHGYSQGTQILLMRVKDVSEKVKFIIQKTKIIASGPIILWQMECKQVEGVTDLFSWVQNHLDSDCFFQKQKTLAPWKKSYDKPRQHIKKERHHCVDKGPYSQSCGFSSNHVWMRVGP